MQKGSWKRLFDLFVSSLLLIASVPVLLLVGIGVLLTSGWPIIFTQTRLGKNKQPFTVYKFRTMINGAEKKQTKLMTRNIAPSPMFKIEHDPRYTQLGYFLAHTGIDELPQLVNVIKNEMSLVGPRPLPIREGNKLDRSWNRRWQVLPGLFSEWVLSPRRYESLASWKKLELETIQHDSITYDFSLLVRVLVRQGRILLKILPTLFT